MSRLQLRRIMKIEGDFVVDERVYSENTSIKELRKSVVLTLSGGLTLVAEEGSLIPEGVDEVHIVAQLTPSGTIDLRIVPITPANEDEYNRKFERAQDLELENLKKKFEKENEERRLKREEELDTAARLELEAEAKAKSLVDSANLNKTAFTEEEIEDKKAEIASRVDGVKEVSDDDGDVSTTNDDINIPNQPKPKGMKLFPDSNPSSSSTSSPQK